MRPVMQGGEKVLKKVFPCGILMKVFSFTKVARFSMEDNKGLARTTGADKVCRKCGATFRGHFCSQCGAKAEEEMTFCPVCGVDRESGEFFYSVILYYILCNMGQRNLREFF